MKLDNPVVAKKTFLSILDIVPEIEAAIAGANQPKDRAFRNRTVARLAALEQNLACTRDALGWTG